MILFGIGYVFVITPKPKAPFKRLGRVKVNMNMVIYVIINIAAMLIATYLFYVIYGSLWEYGLID